VLWEVPVTTGPEDHAAAGPMGRGRLRASDADREHMIDTLKTAFVQGRLTKDELAMRAGQALVSRTYAELAAITADIPAGLIKAPPPLRTARAASRKPINGKAVACGAGMIILSAALGAAFLTYYGGFLVMFLFAFIGFTVTAKP
jgi:hypothetical protein